MVEVVSADVAVEPFVALELDTVIGVVAAVVELVATAGAIESVDAVAIANVASVAMAGSAGDDGAEVLALEEHEAARVVIVPIAHPTARARMIRGW
jgi:hypothetical protein